jgi:hypothetical protein
VEVSSRRYKKVENPGTREGELRRKKKELERTVTERKVVFQIIGSPIPVHRLLLL